MGFNSGLKGLMFTNVAAGWCLGHQPAATLVNITRCCKYSQVLLMMVENIAQDM
jgi:hypothetical protein